ncbi:MAG: B12-binding domain-containing radical SAM protein [Nanoarchaeota archaeon]
MAKHTHHKRMRYIHNKQVEKRNKKKKNVALINSPKEFYVDNSTELGIDNTYPLGLLQISSTLKKDGHNVNYLDANFYHKNINEIADFIKDCRPDIVGMNTTFPNLDLALKVAEDIKKIDNRIRIVLGGPASSLAPETFIQHNQIDYVVAGEGEHAMKLLTRHPNDPYMVPSLYFKQNGRIFSTEKASNIPIDQTPMIDVENIPKELKKYSKEIMLMTSRGCKSACSYCSTPAMWGKGKKNLRTQSVERIFAELENYQSNGFDFNQVYFLDDNFTNDWAKLNAFIDRWNEEYARAGYSWKCLSRIRGINDKTRLEKISESNCYALKVGVESSSNETLRKIGKGLTIEEVDRFIENTKQFPIKTKGFFMIGFPWETEDDVMNTIEYAVNSGFDDIAVNIVMAYPSTNLYDYVYGRNSSITPGIETKEINTLEGQAGKYLAKYGSKPTVSLSEHVSLDYLIEAKKLAFEAFYDGR